MSLERWLLGLAQIRQTETEALIAVEHTNVKSGVRKSRLLSNMAFSDKACFRHAE